MKLRAVLAWFWTVVILGLCWTPRFAMPVPETGPRVFLIPHLDKIVHAGIFFVFGFLWMRVIAWPRSAWKVLIGGLALALISELGQETAIVNRDANLYDGLADSLGLVLGIVAFLALLALRLNERILKD